MIIERNLTIDFLRFFAATMVVFFHFNAPSVFIDNWYGNIVKFGWLGVPIFFVISGYCILLTATTSKNGFDFILKRFFRIYPAYWFSLGVVLSVVLIHLLFYKVNDIVVLPKTFFSILSTIVLNLDPISKIQPINLVYWSLACEICFYIIIGIGLLVFKKYLHFFLLFILLISICIGDLSKGYWWYFLKDWPCFALGISIFYFHTVTSKKQTIIATAFFTLASVALFIQNPINLVTNKQYIIVSFLCFIIILLSTKFKFKSNFLSSLGNYSYGIYLLHVPIGVFLLGFLKREIITSNNYLYIGFDIINYVLVCFLSVVIYELIEKPAIKFGKNLSVKIFVK